MLAASGTECTLCVEVQCIVSFTVQINKNKNKSVQVRPDVKAKFSPEFQNSTVITVKYRKGTCFCRILE